MSRRTPLLALLVALAAVGAWTVVGWLAPAPGEEPEAQARPGDLVFVAGGERWALAPPARAASAGALGAGVATDAHAAGVDLEALQALGYAGLHVAPDAAVGVTVHERDLVADGLNLCTFGHAPLALLVDMDGRVRHRWSLDVTPLLGDALAGRPRRTGDRDGPPELFEKAWRRVRLLDDGALLAIHEGQYLLRVDRDSRLEWVSDLGAHHDLDLTPSGEIVVLTREAHVVPRVHRDKPVLEDAVSWVDPQTGAERRRLSLLDAFWDSDFAPVLERTKSWGDLTHTNTVEVLDGRHAHRSPAFAAGNLLVSLRELDTVAVVDPERGVVVWALAGLWRAQHQPTLLDDGGLLVFDNQGHFGRSRVLELDPLSQQVRWSYTGDADEPFFSRECGSAQRLPDGHTLITETDTGRAFEVTPDGRVVWEFRSPFRAGRHDELVSSLFEVVRLPADAADAWLPATRAVDR